MFSYNIYSNPTHLNQLEPKKYEKMSKNPKMAFRQPTLKSNLSHSFRDKFDFSLRA